MELLFTNANLVLIETFLLSFIISYVSIPALNHVSHVKKLYAFPNGRTSHHKVTPTLGGIAIFSGFLISSMIFVQLSKIPYIQYILAGTIIIFFVGLKDDIIGMSPMKKFLGQLAAAAIIIDLGGVRITDLYDLGGINALSNISSDFISLFIVIAIVNAFNLIDGIDGLASGIGIISSSIFGIWFYLVGEYQLSIVAVALVAALIGFFRYNFFSKKNKIFMGDIGSLLLGFMLAIFAIKFIELNTGLKTISSPYYLHAAPAVAIGILIVPVYDTIRVMLIRMAIGQSPFHADKRHLHHYLLELNQSHKKSTGIILLFNLLFIVLSFLLSWMSTMLLGIILFVLASVLSYIPYYMLKQRRKKNIPSKYTSHIS